MKIRALNEHEKQSIRAALEYYIKNAGSGAWSQKIILEEMLEDLLWIEKR